LKQSARLDRPGTTAGNNFRISGNPREKTLNKKEFLGRGIPEKIFEKYS